MPDTALTDIPRITMTTASGFVVVTKLLTGSVPPYRYTYDYNHFESPAKAEAYFNEVERGEYAPWQPVGIFPAVNGLPFAGPLPILPQPTIERRAA